MNLSAYCLELEEPHRGRYIDKIGCISCDPYLVDFESCSSTIDDFPNILYPDIVMYLVHKKSAYTFDEMKAYKSMEAYNQAVCGWVRKVVVKKFGQYILVLGKVMHSQRLNERLLLPWVIATKEGEILCAHCDCVAGLGEVCTHVAAVLFAIDETLRKSETTTRTGVRAYWMAPTNKPAEPRQIRAIDFKTPKAKAKQEHEVYHREKTRATSLQPLSRQEINVFLQNLITSEGSALHTITQPFAAKIARDVEERKRYLLTSLYKPEYENLEVNELRKIGASVNLTMTVDECRAIQRETVEQSKSKKWFLYRAGRVTASKFKSCCRTKVEKPALSLIKAICYPSTYKVRTRALDYGCQHEKDAIKQFEAMMQETHEQFDVEQMGLFINPEYPYFGASPDGIADCVCCGMSLVEVKCPYCARHSGIVKTMEYKDLFLNNTNGQLTLKTDHAYYYQIQMQLALTKTNKCFLVAWSPQELVYTTVLFDKDFWDREKEVAKSFFYQVILPEVLGKFYTRNDVSNKPSLPRVSEWGSSEEPSDEDSSTANIHTIPSTNRKNILYCTCQKPDDGKAPMIACDSEGCKVKWFHFVCVGLKNVPKGTWLCSNCK